MVIVEGDLAKPPTIALHPHAFKGGILSTVLAWQVPVLFSHDAADTALTLRLIAEQWQRWNNEISLRPGRRPKRLRKRQLYVLQGLPFIGPALAARLLERFRSVEQVMTAPIEQLVTIEGIGIRKAKLIREIVSVNSEVLQCRS
jgi:ERCC4-type nuclease